MVGPDGKHAARMPVSIVAGPAAVDLLQNIRGSQTGTRIGLLTNVEPGGPADGLSVFPLASDNPERIMADIRRYATEGGIDQLIIQCETDRPPMAYASLFVSGDHFPQTLTDVARLTTTWFAIEAGLLVETLLGRGTEALSACFVAEQLEFVSDILLTGNGDLELARTMALTLNPFARIRSLATGPAEIFNVPEPSAFDFEAALNGAGWRQLLDRQQSGSPLPQGVVAFGYHARRPFHPERFWKLLQHNLRGLFRAKGFFWLASRMDEVGGLNLAGSELHCASAGTWWAARDQLSRDSEMPPGTRAEWQEPFGDRRQSFALMALGADGSALRSQIDACLLTEAEMAAGPPSWSELPDPFPSWSSHAHVHHHDHACDHDHGSEEHECCHH